MSPAPSLPADLHYADDAHVELDLNAIIAQGGRIRRRRLIAKVAALAVACAIAPTVIVTDMAVVATNIAGQAPGGHSVVAGPRANADHEGSNSHLSAQKNAAKSYRGAGSAVGTLNGPLFGTSYGPSDWATVERQVSATVPGRLGPVLAMASSRSAHGVWFAAASDRLTLFHMSDHGKLTSVPLDAHGSRPHMAAGLGLAVSPSGVVWIRANETLISYDPRSASVSSWQLPTSMSSVPAQHGTIYSLAVAPDGSVAVASSAASSVQVLDPRSGTFSYYALPEATDRPLAVGYARDGTLGVGYLHSSHTSKVMLVKPSGERLTATVAQATAVMSYGQSGFLVGSGMPDVVSAAGQVRPLTLPDGTRSAARDALPLFPLPEARLGLAQAGAILTFPAHAPSVAAATRQSKLWLVPQARCPRDQACPDGFRMVAANGAGGLWVALKSDPYLVVLLRLG